MKYFFAIIIPIVYSLKTKLCINCKHFTKDFLSNNEFGKCKNFLDDHNNIGYLVTGIKNIDYKYCSTARSFEDMCGKEGKYYICRYNDNKIV